MAARTQIDGSPRADIVEEEIFTETLQAGNVS
jgi:hypothetical protein